MSEERSFLLEVLLRNEVAVDFCERLFAVSQVWDDIIDGDEKVTPDRVNGAFINALLTIPIHPFLQENLGRLVPVMQIAIYDWIGSNELNEGSDHDRSLAFVLRDSLTAVVQQCAFIVGGHEHAISVTPKIRRFFHDETLAEFTGVDP